MRTSTFLRLLTLAVLLSAATPSGAAGPLLVNLDGEPLTWAADPIPFNPDLGPLGSMSNATAVALVASTFAQWAAVSTASIDFTDAGSLPVNVDANNWPSYLDQCDGRSPIIFDTDGSITDDLFGSGASNSILGFAGPDCTTFTTITEGSAVLNGKWIDGIDTPNNREISVAEFTGVFLHEFGHYVNLDHSQVNLVEAFDGDDGNDDAIATMFPFLINGVEAQTLHLDDEVSVSALYPAPSFASAFGTLTGSIFRPDGTTPMQSAYVIARNLADPRLTAVGVASGAYYVAGGSLPLSARGVYEIPGLPPGNYSVEIEEIDAAFVGGSRVGPIDPPPALPGPPEFYNGANEGGTEPPDDPTEMMPLAVAAGATQSGIDIVINAPLPPANDDCSAPTIIASLPFTDSITTEGGTTAPGDPVTSCGLGTGGTSVWYSFTAPSDMIVDFSTLGSSYDTVLALYSGACGSLSELACNDEGIGQQSELAISLTAGQTVRVAVTSYGATEGGALTFNARALACNPTPLAGCRNPTVRGSLLKVTNQTSPDADRLVWKWRGAGLVSDFDNPFGSGDYSLCLYDGVGGVSTLKLAAVMPALSGCDGQPCWQSTATGFRYKDRDLTPSGVQRVLLKANGGTAKLLVKAKGALLAPPALPLAQQPNVIVQLQTGTGCWQGTFGPPANTNDAGRFRDKSN